MGEKRTTKNVKETSLGLKNYLKFPKSRHFQKVFNCMLTRNGIWDSSYLLKKVGEVRIEAQHGVSLSTSNLGFNQIQDAFGF